MDPTKTKEFLEENFEKNFIEPLSDFIRIDNLTPAFDSEFLTNGKIQQAIEHVKKFAESLEIEGLEFHIQDDGTTAPMVVITYEGKGSPNVMLYGHLDKQPHMDGWREGTGPTSPAIIGDKLYGRGGCDDGYVSFLSLLAIKNAILQGAELPRIAIVLETEEESGSKDLIPLLDTCKVWIKDPDYCICLDSGGLNYDNLWLTSTLRGMIGFNLKVSVLDVAAHSGEAGGIVPETFRIANNLLNRLEDPETNRLPEFEVDIPETYLKEAEDVAVILGEGLRTQFKFVEGSKAFHHDDIPQMYLNGTWRPSLAITGADGLPSTSKAGNVLRTSTTLRVSIRIPPGIDSNKALDRAIEILTQDPPNNVKVEILNPIKGDGWCMKDLNESTLKSLNDASMNFFDRNCGSAGVGGSIPFLKVLGDKYPNTQILALGTCGPDSNIHAPDESIDLPFAKKLMGCMSHILSELK